MKVAFVFGKGIDGCGVTKGAHLLEEWLVKNGHETVIIDFDNGVEYVRSAFVKWTGEVIKVPASYSVTDMKEVIGAVNGCDIAIFHSSPTSKQYEYVDRFREFVEQIHDPIIVMFDHGLNRNNINKVPQCAELMTYCDVSVLQSKRGYAAQAYTYLDHTLHGRIIENPIWIDTHSLDKYRKSAEERDKHLLYMGRMSPLKDPAMIPRIQPYMEDWDLSLIGCEKSISSVSMLKDDVATNPSPYTKAHLHKILVYNINSKGEYIIPPLERKKTNTVIKAYQRYYYDWGMRQLGSSFASWCGYRLLEKEDYGTRMEYTMIESFLLTLPVINKMFADDAKSPENKSWGEYFGPLVSQAKEEEALADELNRLYNDREEWTERTRACQGLIHKFNDINVLAPKFIEDVLRLGKRDAKDKINLLDKMEGWFQDIKQLRADGSILATTCRNILQNRRRVIINGQQFPVPKVTVTRSKKLKDSIG